MAKYQRKLRCQNFKAKRVVARKKYSIREVINAILYVDKAGIQRRMLPNHFPDWRIVYYYFRKWAQDVITTANMGERAGAELVMEKLENRFSRLIKILADQGFDGVDFVAKIINTFKIQWEVVVQVLVLKGFSVLPQRWIVERTFAGSHGRLVCFS